MSRFRVRSIKYCSIILCLFLLLPLNNLCSSTSTPEPSLVTTESSGSSSSGTGPRSRSRSPASESEPNDDTASAVNNNNKLTNDMDMSGQLTYSTDETDFFYLDLTGGGQNTIDRVNITPSFTNLSHIDNKSVAIKLKAYTVYDGEQYLLDYKVLGTKQAKINESTIPTANTTSLIFNADRTGRYYLNVSAFYIIDSITSKVIDPEAIINYTLHVTITGITNPDNNNDQKNGTALTGTVSGNTISQADDHWDWYTITSMTRARNIDINVSIKIKDADRTKEGNHYVKMLAVLKYYDLNKCLDLEDFNSGDWKEKYGPNPIKLSFNATFDKAYLGIQSQEYFYNMDDGWVPNSMDCGASTVTYDITKFTQTLVNNPPILYSWNATPTIGNIKDSYYFEVTYTDVDNDPPQFVNVTINDMNYTMTQSTIPTNDGDYANGEVFDITIPGSSFTGIPHDNYAKLDFYFYTRDYFPELSKPLQEVTFDPESYFRVIDNQRPVVKANLPNLWLIPEDHRSKYINLYDIFNDPDKNKYPGELVFQVLSEVGIYGWTNITSSEILIAEVLENDTLRIKPKLDQFGMDIINLRAFDSEGEGTAVYFDLKVNITPINDPPVLIRPIDYTDLAAMHEDHFVNITFEATDATDKYCDPIYYSTDILEKIPLLGADPEKYQFQFSGATGNLSFLPDNDLVGEHEVNITATDEGTIAPVGLSTTKEFKLHILNVNDAPIARITKPKNNAKFNTSSPINVSGENSTDDDIRYGDIIEYYWYLDSEDNLKAYRKEPTVELEPIKKSGKHSLILIVKDSSEKVGRTNITIWVISLVGDLPGGEDTDEDGMPDWYEVKFDLDMEVNDSAADPDNDTYTNLQEYLGKDGVPGGNDSSDPNDLLSYPGDIDADELPDWWEYKYFLSLSHGKDGDPDGDKYSNYKEFLGPDGVPGGDDSSNPLDFNSVPVSTKSKPSSEDDTSGIMLIAGSIIVVIVILLLLGFIVMRNQKKKAEEDKQSGEKKPLYTPAPMPGLPPMHMRMHMRMPPPSPGTVVVPPPGGLPLPMPAPAPMQMQMQRQVQVQVQAPPQTQPPQQQLGLPPAGQVLKTKK